MAGDERQRRAERGSHERVELGPTVETDRGWRVDGTEMRVRMDYKVQAFEPKAAVTNAGA